VVHRLSTPFSVFNKRVKAAVVGLFHFGGEKAGRKFAAALMISHTGAAFAVVVTGIGTGALH